MPAFCVVLIGFVLVACTQGSVPAPLSRQRLDTVVAPAGSPRGDAREAKGIREGKPAREAIVQELVAPSEHPVAVAALSLEHGQPVALVGHLGAEPSTLAARPGSTMKPILAWLAAEASVLPAQESVTCDATFESGFRCFASHGVLSLPDALAVSCNVFAFELAKRMTLERTSAGFARFGFGKKTGLVVDESAGFLATPEWAASEGTSAEQRWDLLVGAGHGPIEVTPLQLARAYVELLERLDGPNAEVSDRLRWEIREGLRRVVEEEHGTAHAAASDRVRFGGKTGTAEGGRVGEEVSGAENSWFVGFAPLESPEFVVAVLVVGGGGGVAPAAPFAGQILERLVVAKQQSPSDVR